MGVQQGSQQQMRGPQQQMRGPQQQMKGPQQQMNGVADPDQQRMTRLQAQADKEVEEHKRRLAEQKRKANEPPPPPKTITVMAGSKNRPAWPIAPGIANANQPRQITLVSGEDELEGKKIDLMLPRLLDLSMLILQLVIKQISMDKGIMSLHGLAHLDQQDTK